MPHAVMMVTLLGSHMPFTTRLLLYGYESITICAQDSITVSEYNSSIITSQILSTKLYVQYQHHTANE